MKKWAAITAACVGTLLLIWILIVKWQSGDHFPHHKLSELQTSMDTNAVAQILGQPPHEFTRTNSQGQPYEVWAYPAGAFVSVYVDFTPDGHFQKHRRED